MSGAARVTSTEGRRAGRRWAPAFAGETMNGGATRGVVRGATVVVCTLLLGGCLRDLDPRLGHRHTVAGGKSKEGPAAMRTYGCIRCHTVPGVTGANALVGPPLAGWSKRRFIAGRVPNEPEELVRWIVHPQGIKPGTAMPDLGVTETDARHIAAYLYTLEE